MNPLVLTTFFILHLYRVIRACCKTCDYPVNRGRSTVEHLRSPIWTRRWTGNSASSTSTWKHPIVWWTLRPRKGRWIANKWSTCSLFRVRQKNGWLSTGRSKTKRTMKTNEEVCQSQMRGCMTRWIMQVQGNSRPRNKLLCTAASTLTSRALSISGLMRRLETTSTSLHPRLALTTH